MEQAVAADARATSATGCCSPTSICKSGRFDSARATYRRRDRARSVERARRLSLALIQIAQGRPAAAVGILDDIAGRAPAADVGLAYALGRPVRARRRDARTGGALADGDAAHPPESRARLRPRRRLAPRPRDRRAGHLARRPRRAHGRNGRVLARPGAGADQVASLLGVAPGADPGQPVRLALAPPTPVVAVVAEAVRSKPRRRRRAPSSPAARAGADRGRRRRRAARRGARLLGRRPKPIRTRRSPRRRAEPVRARAPSPRRAASPRRLARPRRAAVEARTTAGHSSRRRPAPRRRSCRPSRRRPPGAGRARSPPPAPRLAPRRAAYVRAAATAPLPRPILARRRAVRSGNAPVVVQLGAFSSEANAERAWQQVARRYGLAGRRAADHHLQPSAAARCTASRSSGFASNADAQRLCGQIRGARRRLLRPRRGRRRLDPLGRALRQSAPAQRLISDLPGPSGPL